MDLVTIRCSMTGRCYRKWENLLPRSLGCGASFRRLLISVADRPKPIGVSKIAGLLRLREPHSIGVLKEIAKSIMANKFRVFWSNEIDLVGEGVRAFGDGDCVKRHCPRLEAMLISLWYLNMRKRKQ